MCPKRKSQANKYKKQDIMSTYYFSQMQKVDDLYDELESWRGTPWRHACSVKGRGADCIGFVWGVFNNLGMLEKTFEKTYPRDWHVHNHEEKLLAGLRDVPGLFEITFDSLYFPFYGDILVFKYGKVSSHVGIYFESQVYHSPNHRVMRSPYREKSYFSRIRHVFRFLVT
jgi:cell wall-associated NlpC family hydrolase